MVLSSNAKILERAFKNFYLKIKIFLGARELALNAIWYAFLGIYGRISICLVLFPFYSWLRSGLDKAHNFTKAIAEKTSLPSGPKLTLLLPVLKDIYHISSTRGVGVASQPFFFLIF